LDARRGRDQAAERVVLGAGLRVRQQVAGRVVAPAEHLVGGIVAARADDGAVFPGLQPVARQVVDVARIGLAGVETGLFS